MVLLDGISVSHRQTFLWKEQISVGEGQKDKKNKTNKNTDELVAADSNLLSLDCPAVAMRLEDVMKAKSPQVLEWHCQLC